MFYEKTAAGCILSMDFANFDRSYSAVNAKLKLNCDIETTEAEVLLHGVY